MMGWVGWRLLWVGLGPEIFGWVGFWKSDPWPTLLLYGIFTFYHSNDFTAVWLSGNTLILINVVALRRARLLQGWVTISRVGLSACHCFSLCRRRMMGSDRWFSCVYILPLLPSASTPLPYLLLLIVPFPSKTSPVQICAYFVDNFSASHKHVSSFLATGMFMH